MSLYILWYEWRNYFIFDYLFLHKIFLVECTVELHEKDIICFEQKEDFKEKI